MTIEEVKEDYNELNRLTDELVKLHSAAPIIREECCKEKIDELTAKLISIDGKYAQVLKELGIADSIYTKHQMSAFIDFLLRFVTSLDSEETKQGEGVEQAVVEPNPPTKIKLEVGRRYLIYNLYGIEDPEKISKCYSVTINGISSNGRAARCGEYWFLIEKVDIIDCIDDVD